MVAGCSRRGWSRALQRSNWAARDVGKCGDSAALPRQRARGSVARMNIAWAEQLKKLLAKKPRLTVAAAESLTAGRVQALIASVSGASDYFLGGVTAYSLDEKVKLLGVNRAHAKKCHCVSQQVAVEMAVGACQLFGADLGVATTGYAEPSRAEGIKVPMAWWALAHVKRGGKIAVISGTVELPGANRLEAQERVADSVVGMLVAYLRGLHEKH
jgi:nicotinamide-nucleotide amidase